MHEFSSFGVIGNDVFEVEVDGGVGGVDGYDD